MKRGNFSVTPDSGTGNASIRINAVENQEIFPIDSSITISGRGMNRVITITQDKRVLNHIGQISFSLNKPSDYGAYILEPIMKNLSIPPEFQKLFLRQNGSFEILAEFEFIGSILEKVTKISVFKIYDEDLRLRPDHLIFQKIKSNGRFEGAFDKHNTSHVGHQNMKGVHLGEGPLVNVIWNIDNFSINDKSKYCFSVSYQEDNEEKQAFSFIEISM